MAALSLGCNRGTGGTEGMVELLQLLRWRLGKHQLFLLFHSLLHLEPEPSSRARSVGSRRCQIVPCPGEPTAGLAESFWCWVFTGGGPISARFASSSVGLKGEEGGRGRAFLQRAEPILPELCVISA